MMYQGKFKIAVCDDLEKDRQSIIELLVRYLDEYDILAEIDTYESGEQFLESDTTQYLLVFMDIYMKEKNGLDTVGQLMKRNPGVQVVFSSTSRECAVEAYQLEALYYLLKPLEYESFSRVMGKFFECYSGVRTVTVKVGRTKEDVYLEDIIWVEADGKRSVLHTREGVFMVSDNIAKLQEVLPSTEFFRPIRWAVVSLQKVKTMSADRMVMSDGTEISISRGERERAKAAYAAYRWKRMKQRL